MASKKKDMYKPLQIRNSTAEFLTFAYQSKGKGIEVRVQNGTIWLSQKSMGFLFDTSSDNIGLHLRNIFKDNELRENSVTEDFSVTASDGKNYSVKHYNLDAIISVGYRVNSQRATAFRQWATAVLRDYALRGYFYQKITDIYSTAMDYDKDSETTRQFFANVQNKLHWAIHGHTAAEIIYKRADSKKEKMGLTAWDKAPGGKIQKSDVNIAKNYLTKNELESLGRIVSAYLDVAEDMAKREIPMTMEDWKNRLDIFLQAADRKILQNTGKITAEIAKQHSETEFEKYRIIQDHLFQSDFDRHLVDI